MKFSLLTLIFTSVIMTQTLAQDTNLSSIENTINFYFDGMLNHNSASIKKAFTPTASMKWVEEGEFKEVNATDALTEYFNSNEASKAVARITSINRQGDAANVGLEIEYETFTFVDYMHLLKINNEWLIVSKTYTTMRRFFKIWVVSSTLKKQGQNYFHQKIKNN